MEQTETLFERFLHNIEPDKDAVAHAQAAHEPVREYLAGHSSIKDYIDNTFLYGSYKRHTAIGDIKDVDIVLLTTFSPTNPLHSPQRVLRQVKAALTRYYEDADSTDYQRRSIRVNDPLPTKPSVKLTLDVIPAIAPNGPDGVLLVPDRELACWVESHPKGHIAYSSELNADEVTGGRFVPLVKIMKWWWKYQASVRQPHEQRPQPKGFWVECLTGQVLQELIDAGLDVKTMSYAEIFVAVLDGIATKYGSAMSVPALPDPGLPGQTISASMTLLEFWEFMDTIRDSRVRAWAALALPEAEASREWNRLFGDVFPIVKAERASFAQESAADFQYSPAERFLSRDLGITEHLQYRISLRRHVANKDGFRSYADGDCSPIGKDRSITFRIVGLDNIPKPYTVYWKVKNSGREAEQARQLRGEISRDQGRNEKTESTRYTGTHYVECYVVNHRGQCIAKARQDVAIV